MNDKSEIAEARRWIQQHCRHGHTKYVLERGVQYVEALVKAGLCVESTDGDDLYEFLIDPDAGPARQRSFVEPTL
jgi:hypothetical protein